MQPPRTDIHTHTIHCGHAKPEQTVAGLLAAADARGLEVLAITEHLHEPAHLERIQKIRDEVAAVEHACTVYIGAEIDADPVAADGSLMASTDGLAYVIASTHHYPDSRDWWYSKPELDDAGRARVVDRWFEWVAAIAANPQVDTLAHPGVLFSQNGLTASYDEVLPRFAELFRVAAAYGKRIELNELAQKKMTAAHRASYPQVIRAAADAGCGLVMVSDAHNPDDVGRFEWVLEIADAAGLGEGAFGLPEWHTEPA